MDVKELKAKQKYAKVVENLKKTEQKLFELREKKRKLAANIQNEYHEHSMVLVGGN